MSQCNWATISGDRGKQGCVTCVPLDVDPSEHVRRFRDVASTHWLVQDKQVPPSSLDTCAERERGALTCGDGVRLGWVQFGKLAI